MPLKAVFYTYDYAYAKGYLCIHRATPHICCETDIKVASISQNLTEEDDPCKSGKQRQIASIQLRSQRHMEMVSPVAH
jgi:hypothetical protein